MRILISAFACSPNRGSEPGVGWNWASRLSVKHHDVHVLTTDWWKESIDEANVTEIYPKLHFHFIPTGIHEIVAFNHRLLGWIDYYRWQMHAYKLATKLHNEYHFDIAQHVTYASWRVPSLLWKLPVPFIWGPVGGGQRSPPGFLSIYGKTGSLYEVTRMMMQRVSRYDPLFRKALSKSSVVLAANTDTWKFFRLFTDRPVGLMTETAYDPPPMRSHARSSAQKRRCRLLWVGVFEARKALPLLLRALAAIPDRTNYELNIIGYGKEEERYRLLVNSLGLNKIVNFIGRVPYPEVQRYFQSADIFVFTSLRETTGNVLLEAMGAALPVVCLNWSGSGDLTDDTCAIRIWPRSPEQVAKELGNALHQLRIDDAVRYTMGKAGYDRLSKLFTWERKIDTIQELYTQLLT